VAAGAAAGELGVSEGLPVFGRNSGRIASPAQRERSPTEGRRVRGRPQGTPAAFPKPCLPWRLRAPSVFRNLVLDDLEAGRLMIACDTSAVVPLMG
jgi:hypothetical protein